MAYKNIRKTLKRSALTIALGLCVAGGVQAQSAVGSVFGETTANATVTIRNDATGFSREISADASGRYTFSQLPPGQYKITSGGQTRDVQVRVGTGSSVDFAGQSATDLDVITVKGTATFNPIDVSSVESTTVFSAQQIQALPVNRNIINVSLLAPGTVRGDTGFGNVASFGGASPAENGVYINGFDVTNIFNFLTYANLPFDAIAEQQVKTGGYGAEYGRSLGGVMSLVTKRGTNEWTGGASVYWSPEALNEHSANVVSRDPRDISSGFRYFVYRADNTSNSLTYNVYAGGPLVKDRLFVFGLAEGQMNSSDTYSDNNSRSDENRKPHGLVKLDWNLNDDHHLELTAISDREKTDVVTYDNPSGELYTGRHGTESARYSVASGGETYIGKYTGYFGDNFTLSGQVGQLKILTGDRDPALLGSEACPRAFDSRANPAQTEKIGCWLEAVTFVRDVTRPPDQDRRNAWRIDAEWRLGDHQIRFGYDDEKFTSQRAGQSYTGGIYYRYFKRPTPFTVKGVTLAANTDYVRTWDYRSLSGSFQVSNTAAYLEDSWQVTDNIMLYAGVRSESFENLNGDGDTFAQADNMIAPRLGFSWDVNGDSSLKVFANAGRYYIPIAANTSVRMAGGDNTAENFYLYDGQIDPVTGAPAHGLGAEIGPHDASVPVAPDPRTVAATNLKPMYQDEIILGVQKQLANDWMVGVRGIQREVKAGMDDYCAHQGFQKWAEDNGYDNANLAYSGEGSGGTMAQCILLNPGRDVELALDLENDGNLQVVTVPASYLGLPKYSRKYNALEFFFEHHDGDKWYLQGSYTYAKLKGTSEGYVNSTLEQEDAGINQDFDHALFERGAYGYLPNDRRHTLKLFGTYKVNDEWQVGGNALVQSGRPVSCNGFIPLDDPSIDDSDVNTPVYDWDLFSQWSGSSFYCRDANGNDVLGSRGDRGRTPWIFSVDASVTYAPAWAGKHLSFDLKVFNVFDTQRVTEYNENSALGTNNSQEPDLNFLNRVNYQAPRSVQIGVHYTF